MAQVTVVDSEAEATGDYTAQEDTEAAGKVAVAICLADGSRCERCWNHSTLLGSHAEHPLLCERCTPTVVNLGFKLPAPAAASV